MSQLQYSAFRSCVDHTECPIVNEMISVVPSDVVNAGLDGRVSSIPHLHETRSLLRNWCKNIGMNFFAIMPKDGLRSCGENATQALRIKLASHFLDQCEGGRYKGSS